MVLSILSSKWKCCRVRPPRITPTPRIVYSPSTSVARSTLFVPALVRPAHLLCPFCPGMHRAFSVWRIRGSYRQRIGCSGATKTDTIHISSQQLFSCRNAAVCRTRTMNCILVLNFTLNDIEARHQCQAPVMRGCLKDSGAYTYKGAHLVGHVAFCCLR
jgi:hypothetical protein